MLDVLENCSYILLVLQGAAAPVYRRLHLPLSKGLSAGLGVRSRASKASTCLKISRCCSPVTFLPRRVGPTARRRLLCDYVQ